MRVALAFAAILVPFAAGAAIVMLGVARRRAPWPWVAGLGFCIVPAIWMASVDLCGQIAGTCIGGDDLTASRQAVFSVIAFALATALLFVRRSPARDAVFAALVLAGEAWLLAKALERDLPPLPLAVAATIVVQLGYEAAVRLARSRRGAAPAA